MAVLGFDRGAKPSCDTVEVGQPLAELVATDANRFKLVQTDANRLGSPCRAPTRRWAPPANHAAAILEFLQGPGGRTGTITAREMEQIHRDVCDEYDFELIGWTAVGRELRRLLGGDRNSYAPDINGKRVRVYRIPPADSCVARGRRQLFIQKQTSTNVTRTSATGH